MSAETTTTGAATTWLTEEAHVRLRATLEELRGPVRQEIVARIEAAREEGDLRENGGYHAAKDEQGKLEARIRQLQQLLREAQVGEAPVADEGRALPGTIVTVQFEDDADTERFLLGSREEHLEALPTYSPSSPLGAAVLNHVKGDVVEYQAPRTTMKVTIVDVEPFTG
jgi:transcription elongation factor GreA